jgi:putative DNA primase/helicase
VTGQRLVAVESDTDKWMSDISAAKDPTALLADWPAHLIRTGNGPVLSHQKNALIVLGFTPQTYGAFAYDEFRGAIVVTRNLRYLPQEIAPFEWVDDRHATSMAAWCNAYGLNKISDAEVCNAVQALADLNRANSARDYFEALRWDGVPRLATWLRVYLGAEGGDDYLSRVGAWFPTGVAARACQPGAKQDYTLVLVMRQGVGKTTVAETLAIRPDWFTDRVSALGSKDSLMELRGRLIVEMAELEVFRKSDVETQKAFLTSTVDKYRAPYGRSILSYPRTCCFVGTTNEETFLHDLTGNRRFWPVRCGDVIDVERLRRDLGQMYAEAYNRWKLQERYWPAIADNAIMEREQERYRIVSPLEETLTGAVMTSPPQDNVTNEFIYQKLGIFGPQEQGRVSRQVAGVMRKLGYRQSNVRIDGKRIRIWTSS